MSISFATTTLQGNVGNVEIKDLESNGQLARFSVACNESYKKDDKWETITNWLQVVTFNPATVKYVERNVTKGRQVFVQGKLRSREWTAEDGSKRTGVEVHADSIQVGARTDADEPAQDAAE